jgi:ABC-type phosphate transport system substrate-binding protein
MFTSTDLKATVTEVRPIIERQLDDATIISTFREKVTAAGGDWSQVKSLVKAMIQDERDEAGQRKKVTTVISKAENALAYAGMLGVGNLNENNYSPDADKPNLRVVG